MDNLIGERIKYLRTLANMSQEELGNRVGVQRAAINKYEKGSVTNIPISTIEKMAVVFNVSPTYLVGWDTADGITNPLSAELKVIQGVKFFYGNDCVDLIESYTNLNNTGKQIIRCLVNDFVKIYSKVNRELTK